MVREVETEEFDKILKGEKPVVCDFFATWCGPCKMLAPVMEQASEEYADRAEFIKADVDKNPELAARYGIMSIPLVVVFKDGVEAAKSLGYSTKSEMKQFLDENL